MGGEHWRFEGAARARAGRQAMRMVVSCMLVVVVVCLGFTGW